MDGRPTSNGPEGRGARTRARAWLVAGAVALLPMAAPAAPGDGAAPFLTRGPNGVIWHRDASMGVPPAVVARARAAVASNPAGSLRTDDAALALLATHDLTRAWAHLRKAERALERGDTLRADSLLGVAAASRGAWEWDARRLRHDLALGRGDLRAALASLGGTPPGGGEEAVARWHLTRARRLMDEADTGDAMRHLRVLAPRALPADSIAGAIAMMEVAARGRPDSLRGLDAIAAAGLADAVDDRAARVRWLREAVKRLPGGRARFEAQLDLADALRAAGRAAESGQYALEIFTSLPPARTPRDSTDRARVCFRRARAQRALGRYDRADELYALAAAWAPRPASYAPGSPARDVFDLAMRHRADMALARDRLPQARRMYAALDGATGPASDEGALGAGLLSIMLGELDEATRWFVRARESPESAFWHGVVTRKTRRAHADSVLGTVAEGPGFGYYRAAARESLGVPPKDVVPAPGLPDSTGPAWLRRAELFMWLGLAPEALRELQATLDARLAGTPGEVGEPTEHAWLRAARAAYVAGDPMLGIRLAHRAFWSRPAPGATSLDRDRIVPWLYPPAYAQMFEEAAQRNELDPALLFAVGWQESFFDAGAVSRAGALGVMQFMPATARGVAAQLGEPTPAEADMLDPARSIRFGGHYLAALIRRFDGRIPPALAAYNAGPGNARRWITRAGGDTGALYCEVIGFGETTNYVKNILGAWQAYRTYRPAWATR